MADLITRPITVDNLEVCASITYEAFKGISEQHGFPSDFPTLEIALEAIKLMTAHPLFFGVVAERNGKIEGCAFMDERNPIRGIGPVSVSPQAQGKGIGRLLMTTLLARGQNAVGIRLLQETYNLAALSLYTALGFEVKEPLVFIQGKPRSQPLSGFEIRPLDRQDLAECVKLSQHVFGWDRAGEIADSLYAIENITDPPQDNITKPFTAWKAGRMVAYTTSGSFVGHGAAETEEDMQALLLGIAALTSEPLSFHLPTRQTSFFRWCLQEGLRTEKPGTLMALGDYQQPKGCYFTSFLY